MKNRLSTFAAAALFAMSIVPFTNNASATPVAAALAIKNAAPTNIEIVRWRGHRGWGPGVGAAIVGGAILADYLPLLITTATAPTAMSPAPTSTAPVATR